MTTREVNLILLGVGAVGRGLLRLLLEKGMVLQERYGFQARVVAALDSGGALVDQSGLSPAALLEHKGRGESVATLPGGQAGANLGDVLERVRADVLVDASPVDLATGAPGLPAVQMALDRGMDVVLANKAPLVLAYADLHARARARGARVAFSATVCGGLPVINMGQRDLVAATVQRFRGIVNSTTNYILTRMAAGETYADALAEAQTRGIAEADPSLDVEGWDAAAKLVIIANAVLGVRVTLDDLAHVEGIVGITPADLAAARARGEVIKLVARAERRADGVYDLRVQPESLPEDDFLARVSGWEMGVVFETDIYETIFAKIDERDPVTTAAAVLRDVVNISRVSGT